MIMWTLAGNPAYPAGRSSSGEAAPLWLRLEHNSPEDLTPLAQQMEDRKENMGSALMGSLQMLCFLTDLWVTPVNLLLYSQKCQGVFFPQSDKINYFCSGHISVDPISPQPRGANERTPRRRAPRRGRRASVRLLRARAGAGLQEQCLISRRVLPRQI